MKILVACEESGIVTAELRKRGHEAYSCDLEPTSGNHPECHIQQDVMPLLDGYISFHTLDGNRHECGQKWDMVIAFPPCTHLASSGAAYWKEKQADGRQPAAIEFFMRFVNCDCERIAIENPVGIISKVYRKPDQIIQPWQFGDNASKKTCLWLKGLPALIPTNIVDKGEFYKIYPPAKNGKAYTVPLWYQKLSGFPPAERAKMRSKTFSGIACAMAEQWTENML